MKRQETKETEDWALEATAPPLGALLNSKSVFSNFGEDFPANPTAPPNNNIVNNNNN